MTNEARFSPFIGLFYPPPHSNPANVFQIGLHFLKFSSTLVLQVPAMSTSPNYTNFCTLSELCLIKMGVY